MLYREIFAVCSEIHAKYTNTSCGQYVAFFFIVLNLVVYIVNTGRQRVESRAIHKAWEIFPHMFVVTAFRCSHFLHNVYLFIYDLFSMLSTAQTACM